MQHFDCLAKNLPLFGPHLLEASAGTGKTFSIEHIFVRLILASIELEQILAVTFTRAATRELKARIRTNLDKALTYLQSNTAPWEYLEPYLGSTEATRLLTDALAGFDRCQIFTIHGFCYRMLKEFAFEAKVGFFSDPDKGPKVPTRLKQAVSDFLENGIDPSLLCPEQLTQIFKDFDSIEELENKLLHLEDGEQTLSFSDISAKCKAALHPWQLDESKLLEDFHTLAKGYKAATKGNFEIQIKALANFDSFPALFKERGTLFDFFDPSNRKVKATTPAHLHYPGFFDWARTHIAPLIKQKTFPTLQATWNPIAKKILEQEEYFDPDEMLSQMHTAVKNPLFANSIRQKYAAAIIDEFQDTDAVQWEIFQHLFLNPPIKALYLVGDPKQSIYRFRKADVYTYLQARDLLGEANIYHLDTNFRSSKPLIEALNTLFSRNWLELPKVNRILPYHPVKAGAKIDPTLPDDKGAIHFFTATGEPITLFDDAFLPFTVSEIERLHLRNCAILVKDRYQAQKSLDLLRERNIPAIAKSHTPLGKTAAFQSIRELFEAILSPHDTSAAKIVLAGPFAKSDLTDAKILLQEKGLVALARNLDLDTDAMQIFELLFAWEKQEGFSFEGLNRYLHTLHNLTPDEGGRRRMETDEEAIQIMTLHISKGLEFDTVFALGLISRTPEGDNELDAEKLRQLYVAMTRAKKRLYIPLPLSPKDPAPGTHSPLELFSRYFDTPFLDQLHAFAKTDSITIESLTTPIALGPICPPKLSPHKLQPLPRPFTHAYLSSFTTLAKVQETETKWIPNEPNIFTLQTMPRGSETGITIHTIFEQLFSASEPIWRTPAAMDALVHQHLRFSPLAPWTHAIQQMVHQTVTMPLQTDTNTFSLSEIDQFQVEMEFVFSSSPNFVKGFIDLVFHHHGKIYFIDWKTNWLEDYSPTSLQKAMQAHDYGLQASLYTEALKRHCKETFGEAFYFFVRGGAYLMT